MAHFLISGIVGHLGSQACLLESYLYPLLLPLLTAQRTTFVDLVFFFFSFFAFFAFNRINWEGEQMQPNVWGKRKGGEGKEVPWENVWWDWSRVGLVRKAPLAPFLYQVQQTLNQYWPPTPCRSILPLHAPSTWLWHMLVGVEGAVWKGPSLLKPFVRWKIILV